MEAIARNFNSQDWLTLILISCVALLAVTRYVYERRFLNFVGVIGSDKFLAKSSRERFQDPFNLMLFTVQLLSISTFIYLVLSRYGIISGTQPEILFFRIVVCYGVFIGIKFVIERIFALLFDGEEVLRSYHYNKLIFRNFFGMILLPINAIFAYTYMPGQNVVIGLVALIIILNTVSLTNTTKRYEKLISNNIFYFILYLCALEIAPYLILYKLLSIYT